jgi:hypothetical protein
LTAQENFYVYCFYLASRRGIDAIRSSRVAARDQINQISKRPLRKKRKATKRVPKFSCTKDNFMRELQTNLAHTFTYFVNLRFDNSLFLRCDNFQSRCDAHACAVWCSWCTLEWLGYPYDELVIARAITGRERIWMASRLLTTKIPCALLVAIT